MHFKDKIRNLLFSLLLISSFKGYCQEVKIDSSLIFLKSFIKKNLPASNDTIPKSYIYVTYNNLTEISRIKVSIIKSKRTIQIDSLNFKYPYNIDSLINGHFIRKLIVVNSDTISDNTPIVKISIIKPDLFKLNKNLPSIDSISFKKILSPLKNFGVQINNDFSYNNNFYAGQRNSINPRYSSSISINSTFLEIPYSFSNTYSNLRNDNNYNFQDFKFSLDISKFKQNVNAEQINSDTYLSKLRFEKEDIKNSIHTSDSELVKLQNEIDDPYIGEKIKQNEKRYEKLSRLDTLNAENKMQLDNIKSTKESIREKNDKIKKIKLDKAKYLKQLKNFELEEFDYKQKLLSKKEVKKALTNKNKYVGIYNLLFNVEKFDIGKIAPRYSELSINGLTYNGVNAQSNIGKVNVFLTSGFINNKFNLNRLNENSIIGSKFQYLELTGNTYFTFLYINSTDRLNLVTKSKNYLITSIGGENFLNKDISLNWELAYSDNDTSYGVENKFKDKKVWFNTFNPENIAVNFGLQGKLFKNLAFELSSKYAGYGHINPANVNLRNDYLRNMLKLSKVFFRSKLSLTYTAKLDLDNFSNYKPSTTKNIYNSINSGISLSKNLKLNILYANNFLLTTYSIQNRIEQFKLNTDILNISLIHNRFNKSKTILYNSVLMNSYIKSSNFNENVIKDELVNSLTLNNNINLMKRDLSISTVLNFLKGSVDTANFYSIEQSISKLHNNLKLTFGENYKFSSDLYEYKSIFTSFGFQQKVYSLELRLDFLKIKDSFVIPNIRDKTDFLVKINFKVKL
jgi:hypothetical protein